MYTAKAFMYYSAGNVRQETLSISCGPHDIIVHVDLCARCGTDRTIFTRGHPTVDAHAPIVLGHEMVGHIVEVGSGVKNLTNGLGYCSNTHLTPEYLDFKPGERIIVQSRAARYANGLMLMSDPVTILSFYTNGGYSQYMKITPELIRTGSVIRVPENASRESAALAEPAACALESIFAMPHAIGVDSEGRHQYRSGILKGGRCCVIGTGAVSIIYARLARIEGASQIVVLARSEHKAAQVRQLLDGEATVEIIPSYGSVALSEKLLTENQIIAHMKEVTGGHLFDDVIAACSDSDAQRLMLKLYSPDGYAVGACFGGTRKMIDGVDMDAHHYRIAKTIGTSGCSTRTLETVVRWLAEGRLSLDGFISPRLYGFDDDPAEFFTSDGNGLRPALDPWKQRVKNGEI